MIIILVRSMYAWRCMLVVASQMVWLVSLQLIVIVNNYVLIKRSLDFGLIAIHLKAIFSTLNSSTKIGWGMWTCTLNASYCMGLPLHDDSKFRSPQKNVCFLRIDNKTNFQWCNMKPVYISTQKNPIKHISTPFT